MKIANNPRVDVEGLRALPSDRMSSRLSVANNQKVEQIEGLPRDSAKRFLSVANNPAVDRSSLILLPSEPPEPEPELDDDFEGAGFIYAARNPDWLGCLKVGRSVQPWDRVRDFNTYHPERNYQLLYAEYVDGYVRVEYLVKKLLQPYRVFAEVGEWFTCNLDEVKRVVSQAVSPPLHSTTFDTI